MDENVTPFPPLSAKPTGDMPESSPPTRRYRKLSRVFMVVIRIAVAIIFVALLLRLVLRFTLASNALVTQLETVTYPLVWPFIGLTGQKIALNGTQFEFATLTAMTVYGGIVVGLWRLGRCNPPSSSYGLSWNSYEG